MTTFTGQKGLYCCCYPDTGSNCRIIDFLRIFNLQKDTDYPFHATIMYSEVVPKEIMLNDGQAKATAHRFYLLGDNLVLLLESENLNNRFKKWTELGCVYPFDQYIPHVTVIEKLSEKRNIASSFFKTYIRKLLTADFSVDITFGGEVISDLE